MEGYWCIYVWSSNIVEYASTGKGFQSFSWLAEQGKLIFSVPVRAQEYGLARRIWPSRPASACSISKLRLNLVLTHGVHLFIPPYAIGLVPSLSGQANAYRWCPLPRVRRHRTRNSQVSSSNGCCLRRSPWTIWCAPLVSHTHFHYWYVIFEQIP